MRFRLKPRPASGKLGRSAGRPQPGRPNVNVQWTPPFAHGLTIGLESRYLFDNRSDWVASVDGYPIGVITTLYDDYGAYRTETGLGGGA